MMVLMSKTNLIVQLGVEDEWKPYLRAQIPLGILSR